MLYSSFLRRWLSQFSEPLLCSRRKGRRSRPRKLNCPPHLEALEDRLVPATATWDGGAILANHNNWGDRFNWVGNNAPVAGDDLVFPAGAARKTNNNDFAAGTNFHSITFTGSDYVLTGNRITLGSATATGAGGVFDNAQSNTINLPLQLAGSSSVFPKIAFSAVAGVTLTVNGVISGTSPFTTLAKQAAGTLVLTAANTYFATTTVEAGVLNIRNGAALGNSGVQTNVLSGATLELQNNITVNGEFITLQGNGVGGTAGALRNVSGNNSILEPPPSASVHLVSASTIRVDAGKLTIQTMSAAEDGSGNPIPTDMTKAGNGLLVLTGTNDRSIINFKANTGGPSGAPLEVNGSYNKSPAAVNGVGRLTGTGTVGALTALSGGFVDPGPFSTGQAGSLTGRLTANGNVLLNPGSHFIVAIDFNVTDQLKVNGTVTVGGSFLDLTVPFELFHPTPGTTFLILDNDGTDLIQGVFKNPVTGTDLTEGAIFTDSFGRPFQITYQGGVNSNDVRLTYQGIAPQFDNRTVTSSIDEGGVAVLSGTIVEPEPNDKFILEVNWGDGTPTEVHTFPPGSDGEQISVTHVYADDPISGTEFPVSVSWHDQFGLGNSDTLAVTVNNVEPQVDAGGDRTVRAGANFGRPGSFADPGADIWTATVDYGDGSGEQALDLKDQRFKLQHRYTEPGTYTVTVTVQDDDGGIGTDTFTVFVEAHPGGGSNAVGGNALDAFFALLGGAAEEDGLPLSRRSRRT